MSIVVIAAPVTITSILNEEKDNILDKVFQHLAFIFSPTIWTHIHTPIYGEFDFRHVTIGASANKAFDIHQMRATLADVGNRVKFRHDFTVHSNINAESVQ